MPYFFAIDTCTRMCSLALRDEHRVCSEHTWLVERHHTATISTHINQMCVEAGITPAQLSAVIVALGPGSFTGVRCGLSIAKGLALAAGFPVIGVTAFEILRAAQAFEATVAQPIYALVEAGRKRVAVNRFDGSSLEPNQFCIQSWEEFSATLRHPAYVCGDIPSTLQPTLLLRLAPPALNVRRAGILADLGHARYERGIFDNLDTLSPIYPPAS